VFSHVHSPFLGHFISASSRKSSCRHYPLSHFNLCLRAISLCALTSFNCWLLLLFQSSLWSSHFNLHLQASCTGGPFNLTLATCLSFAPGCFQIFHDCFWFFAWSGVCVCVVDCFVRYVYAELLRRGEVVAATPRRAEAFW